ncbi:MAG: metallophosphoesterase [Polyangia bacterium]
MKTWLVALALAGCETTAPHDMTSPASTAIRFSVISDYGSDDHAERRVADIAKAQKPDFIITLGDNNYEFGQAETIDQNIGKYYGEYIGEYQGKLAKGSPSNRFWPSIGNHDWNSKPGGSVQPYLDYFPALPGNRRYYDFVVGNVHFFALDSDKHEPDGITFDSVQGQWLHTALAAATECYKVVYFHHPPYSSGKTDYTVTQMRWPFREWGADLVLSGHQHQYERMEVDGITYVVAGLGGALNRFDFFATQPGSVVRFNSAFGALRATIDDDGLHFAFVDIHELVVDTFTIAKACR